MTDFTLHTITLLFVINFITFSLQITSFSNVNLKNLLLRNNAILEVRQSNYNDEKEIVALLLQGYYLNEGPKIYADGDLICLPFTGCGTEDLIINNKQQWIGLIYNTIHESNNSQQAQCLSLLERVKKAMIFGASAIIILSLNPNILKELDVAHLLKKPLILVKDLDNITVLLNAVKSKMKLKLRIIYGKSLYDTQTFTIWSACWRARPGSGVVCRSDNKKIDSGTWWSYFYTFLIILILILILKSSHRQDTDEFDEPSSSVTQIAFNLLKTKRYRKVIYNHNDNDTCAICLDSFLYKQKLRVLPCTHEFHMWCVDQWLCINYTCPLCKQNINFLTN